MLVQNRTNTKMSKMDRPESTQSLDVEASSAILLLQVFKWYNQVHCGNQDQGHAIIGSFIKLHALY